MKVDFEEYEREMQEYTRKRRAYNATLTVFTIVAGIMILIGLINVAEKVVGL